MNQFMNDFSVANELKVINDERFEESGLPESLRKQFANPDALVKVQEAIEIENEWLLAEREEMVEYIRTLKKLAVYLAGKTDTCSDARCGGFFNKAERLFPNYLQKEIEIGSNRQ
jgi:hypothetical protein